MTASVQELTMPKWGLTMEEGTLAKWLIDEGSQIEPGMAIAEVETDKIVNVMEANQSGVLAKQIADEGDVLPVGALIGVITQGDAAESAIADFIANFGSEEDSAPAEESACSAASDDIYCLTMPKWGLTMEEGTLVKWLVDEGGQIEVGMAVAEVETDKIVNVMESSRAGILRRKIADEGDELPVGALLGVMADASVSDQAIDAFLAGGATETVAEDTPAPAAEEPQAEPAAAGQILDGSLPLEGMRAAISKTVTTSWTTIPHYMVTVAIDMGRAEALSSAQKQAGKRVSINDMLIKASALAIQKYPLINAAFSGKNITLHRDVNVAMAIGLEEGVIMPVIRECQNLTVQQIGERSRELVGLAKESKLGSGELSGGTFAISNMGMLGVEDFIAIVPPNLSAILAVGMVKDEPVVRDGQVVVARMMRVTVSADHRVHDGAYAAKFLGELKGILEAPETILA
jgi:pyruvate dehydrogenase E2 component (dihydrolipoamide acetyltransferase)